MKKIILLLSFIGFLLIGFSQNYISYGFKKKFRTTQVKPNSEKVFIITDEMPSFPGGDEARIKFLEKNIKYPNYAYLRGIEGTVYVRFIVEKNGSISNIKILRGIYPDCDKEVIRVVKLFPKWIPGKQKGKTVRVQFNMPIKFKLSDK